MSDAAWGGLAVPSGHGPGGGPRWLDAYRRRIAVTDAALVVTVVAAALVVQLVLGDPSVAPSGDRNVIVNYPTVSLLLVVTWFTLLFAHGTRDGRVLGTGIPEYKTIFSAGMTLFAGVAIAAVFAKIDISRSYLLITVPLATGALIAARHVHRDLLRRERRNGRMSRRVVLLGSYESASHVALELSRNPEAGYLVRGACIAGGGPSPHLEGGTVPVLGGLDDVLASLAAAGADTVVVTGSDDLSPARLRALSWALEPGRFHLVVAPGLSGVGGPRIHTRPVAGLPLIHVETPRFTGGRWVVKRAFDIVLSALLLLVLALPLLVVAALVKVTSKGPALYGQERIGMNGSTFTMQKFRSMRVGADDELQSLLESQGTAGTPLFKVADDPRVTPLGKVIRRFSIDEFPQLLNVLGGSMSLVGPRPQRSAEVALYDTAARRRLLLKPGMGGLWQVSGRSNLSWEDAIKLDLYYVENWSVLGDLVILFRTAKQVVAPEGAH